MSFNILGGEADQLPVLSVIAPGSDSTFYPNTLLTGLVGLPLDPLHGETEYDFQLSKDEFRHIQLFYNTQVQFVSQDCGERYVFTNLELGDHDFDSIRINNTVPVSSTTSTTVANVEIYRCPRLDIMGIAFTDDAIVRSITTDFMGTIYESTDTITSIGLPLNTDAAATNFVFEFANGLSKRLNVKYVRKDSLVSARCGIQPVLETLSYDPDLTDFVVSVTQDSIQDLPIANLEIDP